MTIIFVLFCASASAGLAIGLVFFRADATLLASPLIALFSAAMLRNHGFGLAQNMLILVGSLTTLQSFYLVGAILKYPATDDLQDRW